MAAAETVKENIWLENLLEELGFEQLNAVLFYDSQIVIYLTMNCKFHSRSKHIRFKYHFVREHIEEGELDLRKLSAWLVMIT